ncbi:MAG: TIR domain-containing protein [Candidatus Delongbacteria bacterium]|nr:TIR domain-containing protein [Candidatus Delongbacteria bacterium]
MAHDVFISYSHNDKTIADAMCHYLESNNIKCWIAPRDIQGGDKWAQSIAAAIPSSNIFLLVFSSSSNISEQVMREVELAVSAKLIILPVKIEDIIPTGGMAYYLASVHWIDAVGDKNERKIKTLSDKIKTILLKVEKPKEQVKGKKLKINVPLWISLAVAIIILTSILLFAFRNSIFNLSQNMSETIESEPSTFANEVAAQTTEGITEITPATTVFESIPKYTDDANLSLNTVVNIPDNSLRSCIMETFANMAIYIEDQITIGDMQKLNSLIIVSTTEDAPQEDNFTRIPYVISNSAIETLEGLEYANNLQTLIISGQSISDISPLMQISALKYIDLSNNEIADISPLNTNVHIDYLNLGMNKIQNIDNIGLFYKLNWLDLSGNLIVDISPLSQLWSLQGLKIDDMNIYVLTSLETLENLEYLSVSKNPITSFMAIRTLNNLYELDITDCNITEAYSLKFCRTLKRISIGGNDITDMEALLSINTLQEVILTQSMIDENADTIDALIEKGCTITILD